MISRCQEVPVKAWHVWTEDDDGDCYVELCYAPSRPQAILSSEAWLTGDYEWVEMRVRRAPLLDGLDLDPGTGVPVDHEEACFLGWEHYGLRFEDVADPPDGCGREGFHQWYLENERYL